MIRSANIIRPVWVRATEKIRSITRKTGILRKCGLMHHLRANFHTKAQRLCSETCKFDFIRWADFRANNLGTPSVLYIVPCSPMGEGVGEIVKERS